VRSQSRGFSGAGHSLVGSVGNPRTCLHEPASDGDVVKNEEKDNQSLVRTTVASGTWTQDDGIETQNIFK
jgi:hypothetical protein